MARNKVLEQLLGDDLAQVRGITEKAMFGGWAWLLHGNLLCGARNDGMLMRLGKGNDAWALAMPGIEPMIMQGRQMQGWVRAAPEVYEDDMLRRKLLKAALDFTGSLPKK
jgi:TfoX N-terminal domain